MGWGASLTIDMPSDLQSTLAEKRDFYVTGSFSPDIVKPGDVRVELYRGNAPVGAPIRVMQSSVDPALGVTTTATMEQHYSGGLDWGQTIVPDLSNYPGGFYFPGNKAVITRMWYAATVLGGCTKDFDTSYTDDLGNPLEDLTSGTYTILVTGLTNDIAGLTTTKTITFARTHLALGRFSPENHKMRVAEYGAAHNEIVAFDLFPGYFTSAPFLNGKGYEINNRWRPNNAIEIVNDMPGTLVDFISNAVNDLILYNVREDSATQQVEIGMMLKYNHADSPQIIWLYYDIGEPDMVYTKPDLTTAGLYGLIVPFSSGERLAINRVETRCASTGFHENNFKPWDPTPKTVDVDLSDGAQARTCDIFSIFGVVKPIPAGVTEGPYHYQFTADNRIAKIHYVIRAPGGGEVLNEQRDVNLVRNYDINNPTKPYASNCEFNNEFQISGASGAHTVSLTGLDKNGTEVAGAQKTLTVNITSGECAVAAQNYIWYY